METNGISLNSNQEEKKDERSKSARSSLFIGVLAGLGLAAALAFAFMLGGRGNGASEAAPVAVVEQVADENSGADGAGDTSGDGGALQGGGAPVSEQTVAPEEPADDPTAVPTDEPTVTPTATPEPEDDPDPEPDPCPFCPEIVDDLQIEPTPVIFCPLCLDPEIAVDLPELEFEYTGTSLCGGKASFGAALNRDAEIWVAYELDGATHETEHTFGDGFYTEVDAVWGWFGDWGWFYPYHITFHAEDGDGNHIQKQVQGDYC